MLYAYPMDRYGCGHYRVVWPSEALTRQGFPGAKLVFPDQESGVRVDIDHHKRVRGVVLPDDCSAVLLQRPTSEVLVDTIPFMQRKGIKVLIDIDDDLGSINPRHPSWHALHKEHTGAVGHTWKATEKACAIADRVIVSTPALANRYGKHGRVKLCRNSLSVDAFAVSKDSLDTDLKVSKTNPLSLGWPGLLDTHPDDLRVLGATYQRLGLPVHIIGAEPNVRHIVPRRVLGGVEPTFEGMVQFEDWLATIDRVLGHGRGIGIAPLEPGRFNAAKSWIKPLEMAVVGVPVVSTPTPEYLALGVGLFAEKPKQWLAQLRRLADSGDFRLSEIERNRKIAEKHTYENDVETWFNAWHTW